MIAVERFQVRDEFASVESGMKRPYGCGDSIIAYVFEHARPDEPWYGLLRDTLQRYYMIKRILDEPCQYFRLHRNRTSIVVPSYLVIAGMLH